MGQQLTWIEALYTWGNNSFTWGDVQNFNNVSAALGDVNFFSPSVKKKVKKVASDEEIESFVRVIGEINGKLFVNKKKRSKLTLRNISVKDIHNAYRKLTVKIQVEK